MKQQTVAVRADAKPLDTDFIWRVFYVFAVLALLSVAISVGGKWLGKSIAMAGHTDDTTIHEIVIGNNVLSAPANAIRFERARRDGVADRLDLYLHWPDMRGYSEAVRNDFNDLDGVKRIMFVSFEERMMSRDMSGRLEPIYRSMIVTPGKSGPSAITFFGFTKKSGYMNELLAVAARPGKEPFVARCLSGPSARGIAGALRARHSCRRRSQPVLPVSDRVAEGLAGAGQGRQGPGQEDDPDGKILEPERSVSGQIDVEDGHREIVGQVAVVIVLEDDAEEFLAEIELAGIVLARARLHLQRRILERPLEIGVELADFFGLQDGLRYRGRFDLRRASGTRRMPV